MRDFKTYRGRVSVCLILSLLVLGAAPALADKAAAEATLKAKGLELKPPYFILPQEKDLTKLAAELRQSKITLARKLADSRRAEKKVDQVKAALAHKDLEARKIYKELAEGGLTVERNNQLVGKLEILKQEMEEIEQQYLKKFQEEFNKVNEKYIEARDEYIAKALSAEKQVKEVAAKYAALAGDAEVAKAIDAIAAADERKYVLGPSPQFKAANAVATSVAREIVSEEVEVRVEDDVPWVEVIINGKARRSMVFDSGASLISVPADLAKDLGLIPSSDTPMVRLQLADGKIVEGWLMELRSVQLGPFKVENVECAVLPDELIAAQPLLGGTFLKHFVYKLDLKNGKLDMSQVKGQ